MKKILTLVGARPHFMKSAALSRAIQASTQLNEVLVHSGQHYDDEMSGNFFSEFNMSKPNYHLGVGSASPNQQMGDCILKLDAVLVKEKPDMVIVFGDTNTTAAGAIAAKKRDLVLIHVEAGLREFDKRIPEEINKLITDAISDYYFTPTATGVRNLAAQGINDRVFQTGDITFDLLQDFAYENKISFCHRWNLPAQYGFMTCHRANNTDVAHNLSSILQAAVQIDQPIFFPVHPRTMAAMKKFNLKSILDGSKVSINAPIGYWDTQHMIRYADFVLTDSGGVIKECYYHRTPGIIVDNQTEWVETVEEGWNTIAGPCRERILVAHRVIQIPSEHRQSLGNGTAGKQIVNVLEKL